MSTSTKPAKKSGGRGGRSRGGGTEKGKGGRTWERAGKHADPGPSAPSAPRVDGPTKELTPEEYDAQQEQYINGLCRNRFLDNLTAMAGQMVKVQRLDGSVIEGVFHTVSSVKSSEYRIVLKASKSAEPGTEPSGYYTAIIPNCEIVQVIVPDLKLHAELPAGAGAGFATDGDITDGSGGHLVGRELSSVSESWLDPSLDKPETLAEMLRKEKGQGKWDQFEANRKITGHTASFDENLYTTKLDATKISTDMEAKALKIADEIENDEAKNIHVAQERNQPIDKNIDEEDLFSGVLRPTPEVKEEKKKSSKLNADAAVFVFQPKAAPFVPANTQAVAPVPPPVEPVLTDHEGLIMDPMNGMMDGGDNMEGYGMVGEEDGDGIYRVGEYPDNPEQPFMQGYAMGEYGYPVPPYYPGQQQQTMHYQMAPRAPGSQAYGYSIPSGAAYAPPYYMAGMQQADLTRPGGENNPRGGRGMGDDRRTTRGGRRKRGGQTRGPASGRGGGQPTGSPGGGRGFV